MNRTGDFKDHFSDDSAGYALARPCYPEPLFDWLAARAPGRGLAWDCATGNGQAARSLAGRFDRVVATDASAEQIASARPADRVAFRVATASDSGLEAGSVDLITVAQALHWFPFDAFFAEARRVLASGGVLAAWCYELHEIDPEIDGLVRRFYFDVVGDHWPPERRHIEAGYASIPFPFAAIEAPPFRMAAAWTLAELLAYLRTWSAVKRAAHALGADPVLALEPELVAAWGDPSARREVTWPLRLRVGRAD